MDRDAVSILGEDPRQFQSQFSSAIENNVEVITRSIKNLSNVLNELRNERVINDYMLRKINNHKNEISRINELIAMLPKRGPTAFEKFVDALDATGNEPLAQLLRGNRLINNMNDNSEDKYRMRSEPRGNVLLVNIGEFGGYHDPREGSEKDVDQLEDLWTRLGHHVQLEKDLTKPEFEKVFTEFVTNEKHINKDCCTIMLMSHGELEGRGGVKMMMKDGQMVASEWILNHLKANRARYLAGKPKVIYFLSCRGKEEDYGALVDSMARLKMDSSATGYPTLSDVLIVYSCAPGNVSFRDTIHGTWFVQEMVRVFKEKADTTHVENLLKEVDRRLLAKTRETGGTFQNICTETRGFNRKLFLNPPLAHYVRP